MDAVGDFICGTAAGIASKVVEYPFDTVKVRLQSGSTSYHSTMDCVRQMLALEGAAGFYRGLTAPVAGAAFENAGVFLCYGRGVAAYRSLASVKDSDPTPLPGVAFGGACGGLATGTILTPVELLKCRVQEEQSRATAEKRASKFRGVVDCALDVVRKNKTQELFHGYSATLAREIPGSAVWFTFYEIALRSLFIPAGKTRDDCQWYAFPIAGAVGGVCYWTSIFPMDSVKTRMQIDESFQKRGLVLSLSTLYRTIGIRGLYSGFAVTIVRAFPANATIFGVYEGAKHVWLNGVKQ